MKNIKLIFSMLFTIVNSVMAQETELPKIIPPSPEAQAFQKYGDIPVSAYTGVPNISIPIYTIKEGDIEIPINLSYHSSGIRVSEESGWVGLGWVLNSGGSIVRNVLGEGDFEHNYFILGQNGIPDITSIPETNTVSPFIYFGCDIPLSGITDPCEYFENDDIVTTGVPFPADDFEPDKFTYQFPGGSGKYILDRNANAIQETQVKIDIKFDFTNKTWKLTDANGFVYEYNDYEKVKPNLNGQLETITAWYLSKISSPNHKTVTYNYNQDVDNDLITISNTNETRTISACASDNSSISASSQNTYQNQTLSSIDFSNGLVLFKYDENRIDLSGAKRLYAIEIYQKDSNGDLEDVPFKKYKLNHSYFEGNNDSFNTFLHPFTSDQINKRLRLDSVDDEPSGQTTKQTYSFEYYENFLNGLPSKTSFAQDYWGFYNGRIGSNHLISDLNRVLNLGGFSGNDNFQNINRNGQIRRVDPNYSTAFTLKKITYPTGGNSSFEYESNSYDPSKSISIGYSDATDAQFNFTEKIGNLNGVRGTQTTMALDLTNAKIENDGNVYVSFDYTFRCQNTNGCSQLFSQDTGEDVFFSIATNSDGSGEISNSRVRLTDGQICFNSESICQRGPNSFALDPQVYYLVANWESHVDLFGMNLNYSYLTETDGEIEDAFDDPYGGGLRIKEITNTDGVGNTYHKKYVYEYSEDRNEDGISETYSYGRLMAIPEDIRWQVDVDYSLTSTGSPAFDTAFCKKFIQSANSNAPLNVNGSIVGYDQVTVLNGKDINGDYGILGKTIYKYKNEIRPVSFEGTRLAGIPNINISSNGLLLEQNDYKFENNDYKIVREIKNTYSSEAINFLTPPEVNDSEIIYGIKKRQMRINLNSPLSDVQLGLLSEFHKNFVFLYTYPVIHSEWIRLLNSTEKIYSSNDDMTFVNTDTNYFYENPSHLQLTRLEVATSDGGKVITENYYPDDVGDVGSLDYEDLQIDEYLAIYQLSQVNQHRVASPVQTVTKVEDELGNVLSKTVQRINFGKWGVNPDPEDSRELVLPKSVQSLKGEYSGSNQMQNRIYFNRYDNQGNVLQVAKADGPPISYVWGHNKTYPVAKIENATYSDVEDILGENFDLAANGLSASQANALRTGLPNAMVTTYTYDPLIGVTSMTDPRGYVMYYEYDDFNRLKAVRDADGNLISDYQYHFKTQP